VKKERDAHVTSPKLRLPVNITIVCDDLITGGIEEMLKVWNLPIRSRLIGRRLRKAGQVENCRDIANEDFDKMHRLVGYYRINADDFNG
jgi:hypothetical protein